MQITGRLENWYITRSISGNLVVVGYIYNDSRHRFIDGELIHTSAIKSVEADVVTTKNSTYQLGKELDTYSKTS